MLTDLRLLFSDSSQFSNLLSKLILLLTIGAVYVFQNDGTGQFQYKQKITPPSTFVAAQYGLIISISRDGLTIAVGLPNLGENGFVDLLSRPTM
jgi:hypothetical protein